MKPTIAFANLQNTIQEKYMESNVDALLELPTRRSTLQTMSRKRKLTRTTNFDPLAPPEELYVIIIYFQFIN